MPCSTGSSLILIANILAITFDDGNMSDLAIAAPELEARGLKATFFVLTGRLGQVGSLGWADVGALQARGMQIGSHGIDHRDLTAINPMELRNEMVRSKQTL